MGLMEDRSPTVTTGLSSVIDPERLDAVAGGTAAAAPDGTKTAGVPHRAGAAHPFASHLLRYGLAGASRINLLDGGLRWL